MKNKITKKMVEKGQVMIFVVLVIFALIAMVALILDGGDIMSNRRTAQAAADSGALAGAQHICMGLPNPIAAAESYAVNNGASTAVATINGNQVSVVATVENASFFAKIFNQDNLRASADATAGCFYPSVAERVLPLAFFYQGAPINSLDAECVDDGLCNMVNWHFDELMEGLSTTAMANSITGIVNHPLDDIYVISDSIKVCEKRNTGEVICSEMLASAGGARTFIDLTDLIAPPANLAKIVQEGLDDPVHVPSWVNTEGAVNADVYNASNYADLDPIVGYEDLEARLFFVPVFDNFCQEGDPRDYPTECTYEPTDIFEYLTNSNTAAYRLVGFAPFVLTGVTKNETCTFGLGAENDEPGIPYDPLEGTWILGTGTIEFGKNAQPCPAWANLKVQLESLGEDYSKDAIEGYFVDEFPANQYVWGTGGVDVGIYLISLSD